MSLMTPVVLVGADDALGFFPDLVLGRRYRIGTTAVTLDAALEFARALDPFSFHTDEVAARKSMFGGLIVSGLQTLSAIHALSIRGGFLTEASILCGAGIDEMRFLRPVRPGDTLTTVAEIVELKASQKAADYGIARLKYWVTNHEDSVVLTFIDNHVVRTRAA